MSALAILEDQTSFDEFQIAVLRQGGVGEDVSNAELAAFLHTCQRRQLDPFTRQIYLIGRYDKSKNRKVYAVQTSIDGFRLIARRAADRSNIDYEYEDTVWFDSKGGRHEVWLSDEPPAAAKVVVVRNGKRYDAVARYSAYVARYASGDPSGQWKNMPDHMIAKCAEALALRKAFPEDLGGLYTGDEMGQADNTVPDGPIVQAHAERVDTRRPASGPVTDEAWFNDIKDRIVSLTSKADGQRLWKEINDKRDARECLTEDVTDLRSLIAMRIEASEAQAAAEQGSQEDPSEVIDGHIVDRTPETMETTAA